ncbi:MAG: restriction endonuclease [Thermoplasmata archaeon HGW-Thermoplasmata-1]|nr:MAG: restriction endonuclease [Thermoplasmata archaeon HGW-Thermoplasmata-1]
MGIMDLNMSNSDIFNRYKSNSQVARVLSEDWFSSNMYCPCCDQDELSAYPNNKKALDFFCGECGNDFQAKCSRTHSARKINDGEYNTMLNHITNNKLPNFFIMNYSPDEWVVRDLFMIPKFFVSPSIIERRNPLSDTARRAGWTGCNILLDMIPSDGKINVVRNEKIIEPDEVRKIWEKMAFLDNRRPELRGWTADVLKCIEDLGKQQFELREIYGCENQLADLHPDNKHVRDKIRQQLQVLRDNEILKFESPGKYRLLC